MRGFVLRIYPWAAPFLAAAAFAATYASVHSVPAAAPYAIPALGAFAAAIVAIAAYGIARIGQARRAAALTAATPAALTAAAFGFFLVADSGVGAAAIAGSSALLAAAYLGYLRGMVKGDGRFRAPDFSHLSFAVHVVTVFFTLAVAYGMPDYLQLPVSYAAVAVAAVMAIAAAESLRRAGLAGRDVVVPSAAFAALGVQLFIGFSFLPTSDLVNAAAGTLLYASGLRVAVAMLDAKAPAPAYGRSFAFTLLLVVIVLSTARWA
ncbi:MAG: hypothetical protein RL272_101 [Candidatus Parcubacteria bacterium]|jgi:hypothetical protein